MKLKVAVKPMQWLHKKRKEIRERRGLKRGAEIASSLNAIDLAEVEAQRMVESILKVEGREQPMTVKDGGGSIRHLMRDGDSSRNLRSDGRMAPPLRAASMGSGIDQMRSQSKRSNKARESKHWNRIDQMRSKFKRSNKVKGDGISDFVVLEEGDGFNGGVSLPDLVTGTGSMQQKGQAGLDNFLNESLTHSGFDNDDSYGQRRNSSTSVSSLPRSHRIKRDSVHLTQEAMNCVPELMQIVKAERVKEWASRFRRSDPRHQIMTYFDDVATLGVNQITNQGVVDADKISPILKMFKKSGVFTVWRPTSLDSIRKMMLGQGVGKGLDIKGKSAKKGKLSGFVPFLQLYEDRHKKLIRTLPKKSGMRIFFQTKELRDEAAEKVADVGEEMLEGFEASQEVLARGDASDDEEERAMEKFMWEMDDPEIVILDEYAEEETAIFGLEIPERLFWEAFVMRQNIYRKPGSEDETGRVSHPTFQDMNFAALRSPPQEGFPRAVVYQSDKKNPMDAKDLVVAYEENNKVVPVVSDFDCFLVGTRSVSYRQPLPDDQLKLVDWCCSRIESVLDDFNRPESWTERWLRVLKESPVKLDMPPFGFGDPTSYSLMELAVNRLNKDGCVRHGAECFNYYFPQELDDHFLIIGEGMHDTGPPWKYVNVEGLQEILLQKIKDGYSFPLNPKWVLCDPGWKKVYDALLESNASNVQESLNCWYPKESGIREKIERISTKHPKGFVRFAAEVDDEAVNLDAPSSSRFEDADENDGTAAMDLAQQMLKSYETLQRAKRKLKMVLIWMSFIMDRQHEVAERKLKEGTGTEDSKAGVLDEGALRQSFKPMLRESLKSPMKRQQLKIRASRDQTDITAPKLLDRLKRQKSFASRQSFIPSQVLRSRSSLPAGTVAASVQGRFGGKSFVSSLSPMTDDILPDFLRSDSCLDESSSSCDESGTIDRPDHISRKSIDDESSD